MNAPGVAVVTGRASVTGEACCRELAGQGFTMAVLDRNADLANEVARSSLTSMPLHAYAPAKKAVNSITENLAVEWGRRTCG